MVYVHMTPPHTHTTAATISLDQTSYIVREGEGSVMVCASVTQGQLNGIVGVQFTTMEGTASKTTLCNFCVTSFKLLGIATTREACFDSQLVLTIYILYIFTMHSS